MHGLVRLPRGYVVTLFMIFMGRNKGGIGMGITNVSTQRYQQTTDSSNFKRRNTLQEKQGVSESILEKKQLQKNMQKVDTYEPSKIGAYDIEKLSQKAQDYLAQLKEKYNMADIIIAEYATDEEARRLMAGSSKAYSIVITPDLLERMATEEETREKYEGILDQGFANMKTIKEQLGEDADNIKSLGMTVDKDGNIKYFATLNNQRIQAEKRLEEKKEKQEAKKAEEKKEEEKIEKEERRSQRVVMADTIEELIEKIKNQNKEEAKEQEMIFAKTAQEEARKGSAVDFSL